MLLKSLAIHILVNIPHPCVVFSIRCTSKIQTLGLGFYFTLNVPDTLWTSSYSLVNSCPCYWRLNDEQPQKMIAKWFLALLGERITCKVLFQLCVIFSGKPCGMFYRHIKQLSWNDNGPWILYRNCRTFKLVIKIPHLKIFSLKKSVGYFKYQWQWKTFTYYFNV